MSSERREQRALSRAPERPGRHLALLALPLLWLALLAASLAVAARTGTTGLTLQASSFAPIDLTDAHDGVRIVAVSPGSPAGEAGVVPGDVLLSADGITPDQPAALARWLYTRRASTPVVLYLRSRGRESASTAPPAAPSSTASPTRDVTLRLEPLLEQSAVRRVIGSYAAAGLVTLAVVLVVFWRSAAADARMLFIAGCAQALWQAVDSFYGGERERWLPLGWDPVDLLGYVGALLQLAAFLHFTLLFPAPSGAYERLRRFGPAWLRRRGGGIGLLYAPPLLLGAVVFFGHVSAVGALWVCAAAYAVLIVACLGRSVMRPASPVARAQMQWVLCAVGLAALALIAGPITQVISGGRLVLVNWFGTIAAWAIVYVALGLAVLRYRLLDVPVVLRSTVLYLLLATLLTAGYAGLALALSAALLPFAGMQPANDVVAVIAAALVVALAASPLHRRLERGLDSLFFRHRRAVQSYLAYAGGVLSRALPPETIAGLLTHEAAAQLGLDGAWLIDDSGAVSASTHAAAIDYPAAGTALVERLATTRGPVVLLKEPLPGSALQTLVADDPLTTAWYDAGARLLWPLRVGAADGSPASHVRSGAHAPLPDRDSEAQATGGEEALVGLWVLGDAPHQPWVLPDRQALSALDRIARQAAVLLDYIRLNRQYLHAQRTLLQERLEQEQHREVQRQRESLLTSVAEERTTLAAVVESLRDGLVVVDAAERIRFCNAYAATLLGIEAHDAVGQPAVVAFARIATSTGPTAAGAYGSADWPDTLARLRTEGTRHLVFGAQAEREVEARYFALTGPAGSSLGYGILLRDVTEARALERAKEEFTSMMTHELRTPLGVIEGFASTLLRSGDDLNDAERRQCLRFILDGADRLTGLVSNLLDMSRISAGVFTVAPRPVRVSTLVRATTQHLRGVKRGRRMEVDVPASLPLVLADPQGIEQVLTNLLDNAFKYSPNGGTVTISAAVSQDGREVILSVADQGNGIPADELNQVFERYRRGRNARALGVGGAGLGLAIARWMAEAHSGRIWAESPVPNRPDGTPPGAVFHLALPVALSPEAESQRSAEDQDDLAPEIAVVAAEASTTSVAGTVGTVGAAP